MKLFSAILSVAFAADVCYTNVGCFTDDPPFSIAGYRPRRLPSSPDSVVTAFKLTNKLVKDQTVDWKNPSSRTNFSNGNKVVAVTHGWISEYDDKSWLNSARDMFRSKTSVNFVAVDWSGGAQVLDYPQAGANTQTAGRAIAYMFNELKNNGFRASDFQCAGHSLGSHVCSYAAKFTKAQFGFTIDRVTGLDAAGPMFEKTTSAVRIDKSDANFVDLIHTNGGNEDLGFLGMNQAVGHADFFPNGGHNQPRCGTNNFVCSHGEAPYYWIDSVDNHDCVFTNCASESDYLNGKCNTCIGSNCNKMGYHAIKPSRNTLYYGNTKSSSPYC